jgi:hypothetical protein
VDLYVACFEEGCRGAVKASKVFDSTAGGRVSADVGYSEVVSTQMGQLG